MIQEVKINTIEELHNWIIAHPYYASNRYTLSNWNGFELHHRESSWRSSYIYLSQELGEQIQQIWNDARSWTIPGMLEKLGDTTIKKTLATERKVKEAQTKKIARNNNRMSLARQAKDFVAYLDAHGENVGISSKDVDVSKILDLENQIEP